VAPHAHFRRMHVSARTLLALYNQARLAYLEKAKRLACRVTPVCAPPAGFAQPPWPNPARNILRLGFRARDHFDIWAKSGPCPASYKAVHGWAELVADHATAGFGLPMAQTPLPVAGGMRCRCSIVRILRFPKLGSRSLILGPAPGEKWSSARLLTKPRSGDV
jgi:hypothetical protein